MAIPSFSDWVDRSDPAVNESRSRTTGAAYAAKVAKLVEAMDKLRGEIYDLRSQLRSEKAPTSVLQYMLDDIGNTLTGSMAYVLKDSMDHGRSCERRLREYDAEVEKVSSIKFPKPTKLAAFADKYSSGFSISPDDVKEWLVDSLTVLSSAKELDAPNGRVTRALVSSIDDRAAEDFRSKTGKRWRSSNPWAEDVATAEEKVQYGAKYVRELNSLLRPFGLVASDTSAVYFQKLYLRKI